VFHGSCLHGNSWWNQDPAVDYFYSAAKHRSRDVLWSIFTLALIEVPDLEMRRVMASL
jgi:hypothetical protein